MSALELREHGRAVAGKVLQHDDLDLGMGCLGRGGLPPREHDDGCHAGVRDALLQHLMADEASGARYDDLHFLFRV